MFLNVMRVRAIGAVVGAVVLIGYFAMGGSFGNRSTIMIEFGMYPREFQGLDVEIDGKVVGQLKMFGAATRTGFSVKDGSHTVRVLHPTLASRPETVTTGAGASQVMLILDIQGGPNGESQIGFQ